MKLESKDLRSPRGIAMAVMIVALAIGYFYWEHASLEKASAVETVKFLKTELPSRYLRGNTATPDPKALDSLRAIKVVDVNVPWLSLQRPRVVVRAIDGAGNSHTVILRFKRQSLWWRFLSASERTS